MPSLDRPPPGRDEPVDPALSTEKKRSTSPWRGVLSIGLTVFVIVFVAMAVRNNWEAVKDDLARLTWVDLVVSGLAVSAAVFFSGIAWRSVLRGMGLPIPLRAGFLVYIAGQLGKYAPGSVWPFVVQAQLGRRHGVPRLTMTASIIVFAMLLMGSGGLLGPLALLNEQGSSALMLAVGGAVGAAVVLMLVYDARLLDGVMTWAENRLGRAMPIWHLPPRAFAVAMTACVASWIMFGLHAWLIARPLGAEVGLLVPMIGVFALAFVGGLAAVPLPAGAGVREAILVIMLAGTIGRPSALALSLISRLVILVAEILLGAVMGLGHVVRGVPLVTSEATEEAS